MRVDGGGGCSGGSFKFISISKNLQKANKNNYLALFSIETSSSSSAPKSAQGRSIM